MYLTFYFEPDLCAGSFRNSPLAKELAAQLEGEAAIDVITTVPNRYSTFKADAPEYEERGNMRIYRINIPQHKSGFTDQINSFKTYYQAALRLVKGKQYDLVFASSSRLFTAYLGYKIARSRKAPLYLDIRDIFTDTMNDVLDKSLAKKAVIPGLKYLENKIFGYARHINLISGGFKPYFAKYTKANYTYFPNGIDDEFLQLPPSRPVEKKKRLITYAGNIGEGQGLHKIIPAAAKALEKDYEFLVIGDGGAKQKLLNELEQLQVSNVKFQAPMPRKELLEIYGGSDFLFIHLNDYDAFKKVLPSKVFELGAYDKPVIAGVAGFANTFVKENLSNVILFLPGDVKAMVQQLEQYQYRLERREDFLNRFKRANINRELAESIKSYLPA